MKLGTLIHQIREYSNRDIIIIIYNATDQIDRNGGNPHNGFLCSDGNYQLVQSYQWRNHKPNTELWVQTWDGNLACRRYTKMSKSYKVGHVTT